MDLGGGGPPGPEDEDAFGGDFYRQEDNHVRGVVLNSSDGPIDGSAGSKAFDAGSLDLPPLEVPGPSGLPAFDTGPVEQHPMFSDAVSPPAQPSDPWFRFETTTAFVPKASAADLGNALLRFFDAEGTATVLKARPQKFTMTVNVQSQGLSCELKVRIYRRASDFAAEFQRRSGEVFVFTAVFQRACGHLGVGPATGVAFAEQAAPPRDLELPKSELVMLSMLRFGRDAGSHGFPCEAPLGLAEESRMLDQLCAADPHTSYWGLLWAL